MSSNDNLVDLFKILADKTRIEILEFLNDKKEKNASWIQKSLNKGQSSISQQLKILVNADLIEVRKESRNKSPISIAFAYLRQIYDHARELNLQIIHTY